MYQADSPHANCIVHAQAASSFLYPRVRFLLCLGTADTCCTHAQDERRFHGADPALDRQQPLF